jgi:hypothetical protein
MYDPQGYVGGIETCPHMRFVLITEIISLPVDGLLSGWMGDLMGNEMLSHMRWLKTKMKLVIAVVVVLISAYMSIEICDEISVEVCGGSSGCD